MFLQYFDPPQFRCKPYAFICRTSSGNVFRLPEDGDYYFGAEWIDWRWTYYESKWLYECKENHYYHDANEGWTVNVGPTLTQSDIWYYEEGNTCRGCECVDVLDCLSQCIYDSDSEPTQTCQDACGTSCKPTQDPTVAPTVAPTMPTTAPTKYPTKPPTTAPTKYPTFTPTKYPTSTPTKHPSRSPTKYPTDIPTQYPTSTPTKYPTQSPSRSPTKDPTDSPTMNFSVRFLGVDLRIHSNFSIVLHMIRMQNY
eukprot:124169_1